MEYAKTITEKLLLKTKEDVLRVHLYTMLLNKGHIPYNKDLDILIALYQRGGYNNGEEQKEFFDLCINKKYKRTFQSLRNTLSTYTSLGVLERPKNEKRFLSKTWIPAIEAEKLVLDYKISHN